MISKNLLYKIAKLYYEDELTQQEIADKLNISRFKVYRYLKEAFNKSIIEINFNPPVESYSELEYKLAKKLNLKECLIVQSLGSKEEIYNLMAKELEKLLTRGLSNNDFLGISWGSTIKGVVGCMSVNKNFSINVMPIVGGVGQVGKYSQTTDSSAKVLADKLGGINFMIHYPAVLDNEGLKKLICNEKNVKYIFDKCKECKYAIVGISDISKEASFVKSGVFTKNEFDLLDRKGIIGDCNLSFFNKNGKIIDTEIDNRLLKFDLRLFKKDCNIIGLAYGSRKAKAIYAAITGKLINILITDLNTAEILLDLLNNSNVKGA